MTPNKSVHTPPEPQPEYLELEKKLQTRQAELDLLKGIQDGLAFGLDIDSIFEQAGERIVQLFPGKGVALYTYDPVEEIGNAKFILENGVRHYPPPFQSGPIAKKAAATKKPLMISTRAEFEAMGAITVPGTSPSLSGMYTPLIVNDVPVGALNIESTTEEHAFNESDLELVSTIAGSLSVALENARLFDELQKRNIELGEALEHKSATSEILHVMAGSQSEIQPVLDAVATNAAKLCEADDVQIYRVEEDRLLQEAHIGPLPGLQDGESLPLVTGLITGRAVLEQRTIHTPDSEQISPADFPESYELQKRLKHRSVIVTPLVLEGKAIGAIVVRRNQVQPFTDDQIALLRTFADQAAIAIENVRLFRETEQRANELAIINSVQAALAAKLDMPAIYQAVGDKIHEVFPDSQVVDILNYDPDTRLFHPRYVIERGVRYEVEPWPARGFRKHVVETGEPLVINTDMEQMAAEYDNDWVVLGEFAKSWVGVPLRVGSEVTGVISLQHIDQENAFSDLDVRLLQTLANSMSVALENARLFDETERLLKETEERNAELAIINTVQRALSAQLDIRGIYAAVGEQLRQIFDTQTIAIYSADLEKRINTTEYAFEKGREFEPVSQPFTSLHDQLIEMDATYVFNGDFPQFAAQFADYSPAQGELPRSIVGVPIRWHDEPNIRVTLTLQDIDGERMFTEADVRLLETLAGSMSAALENARLFDKTERLLKESEQRAAELQIINSVQQALASRLDIQAIYDLVGDKVREIFAADTMFIAFHNLEEQTLDAPYYRDKESPNVAVSRSYGQGLAEKIIDSGAPLLFNTSDEMNAAGAYQIASPGSDQDLNQSFLGVPIFREGRAVGATSVQSYQPYAYTRNDLNLLQTLTNSMAVALENARLFDETERLLQETEQRAAELSSINTVSQALAAEIDLEALIELIGEQIRSIFLADIVYVALLDSETNVIQFPYTYGEDLKPLEYGEGLTGKIIQTGEPLLINSEMDKRRSELGIARIGKKAQSYLGVPIQIGSQTFGTISVQSTSQEDRFCEDDLHLLSTIAANVGTAIRNAQLFEEIKRQKLYYEAVIENSPAAIVLLDMQANVSGWNPAAERLFGYTEAEAIGRNIDDLVARSAELHDEAVRYSEKALQEKQVHILARRTRKDGSLVDVDVSGLPVNVDGRYVGFIAIYHDVTELQRARQVAEQANQAKSTFLANMSHELRTPLNAIIGFTRIVRRKGEDLLPDKQLENLDKVLVSAEHLLSLINSVLDISKIEAGRIEVKPATFDFPPLVREVLDTSQPLMREGVQLKADLQDDLPPLNTDEEKVRQILLNLMSNAAKFTRRGEIVLAARRDGELLRVDVADTGIGVPPDAVERIFEEFQQADSSTTREYGGTGLGLSISRSLARLLGGDLTACSVEGEGSTFSLSLPLRYSEPAAEASTQEVETDVDLKAGELLVLAIDDDEDVHELLKENLGDHGYQVIGAGTAEEGLRLAGELHPFAITLDIMMSGKDGWQVLHELKSDPGTREIPVILVTIVDKTELGYQLGADDYLVKPLEEGALLAALQRISADRQLGERSSLLVVDDDADVPDMVRQLLEGEPYRIMSAADGEEALGLLTETIPDLILLDLLMPRMDGFAFLQALNEAGYRLPVIVLTAKTLSPADMELLEGRVEGIIKKNGLDQKRLLKELRQTMEGYRSRLSTDKGPSTAGIRA
jgi:PAS domain S-box-containing protein